MRNMKRMRKDLEASINPLIVIAIIAILVIAGVGYYLISNEDEGDTKIEAKITMFITHDDGTGTIEGEVDGGALTFGEQMMLTFWEDGVRDTTMQATETGNGGSGGSSGSGGSTSGTVNTVPLAKESKYHIGAVVKAKVTTVGSDIKQCNALYISCVGWPAGHASATNWKSALSHNGENNVTRSQTSATFGTEYTYNFNSDGKSWDGICKPNTQTRDADLRGKNIDGMKVKFWLMADIEAKNGEKFTITKEVIVTFDVVSWLEAQVVLSVVSVGVSSNPA